MDSRPSDIPLGSRPSDIPLGSRPSDIPLGSRRNDRTMGSLPDDRPVVSRRNHRPALCLCISNVIKKELGGEKKSTVRRVTFEEYNYLNNRVLIQEIGPVNKLKSKNIQTLKNRVSLREIGRVKRRFGRPNKIRAFPIKIRKCRSCCGNNVCTCRDP